MKTNNIPALITLSAGAIYCIIGLSEHLNSVTFCKELLIVLLIFYVVGCIIRAILDKSFKGFGEDDVIDSEESEAETEDTINEAETEHITTDEEKEDFERE